RFPQSPSLSVDGKGYGSGIAYVAASNKDLAGSYGTAHGEIISTFYGGSNQDYHYVAIVFDVNTPNSLNVWDQRRQEVGDGVTTRGYNSTTPATHTTSAHTILRSLHSHGIFLGREGRYGFITRSDNTNPNGGPYHEIIWDTLNNSFVRLNDVNSYSGHVTLGY